VFREQSLSVLNTPRQIELLNRKRWTTKLELTMAIADSIENFYNCDRRHSSLGNLTPNEFEDLQFH